MARYIEQYLHPGWRHLGRIRVCLTLRNQAEWLASRYAQRATNIWSASQRDFEAQVEMILETADPAMDWYTIARDIADVVGEDNTRVLLFEDIAQETFWREFARFMACDHDTIDRSATGRTARENKRSDDAGNVWTIRPRSKRKLLYTHLEETYSNGDSGLLRKLTLPVVRAVEPVVLRPILDRKRESRIRLTPALRQRVRDHFAQSNKRLGEWLGRDLRELGY